MNEQNTPQQPSITVASLEFSDGTTLSFTPSDIVLVVGPNNAGKSATLRAIRDKLNHPATVSPVLKGLSIRKTGTAAEFTQWIGTWAKKLPNHPGDPVFAAVGQNIQQSQFTQYWQRGDNMLGPVGRWMCHFLSADERLGICNPPGAISLTQEGPSHPIHYMQRDDGLERLLSRRFRRAFAADLVVHHNAGSSVPLHVGERPTLREGEERISLSYVERLETLPQLQTQGDGMRSFAGVLLATSVGRETVMLIDEPEAFLHPPQAKLLGAYLVEGRGASRQIFIATHSTDILRGVLDANSPDTKVVRIRRDGAANSVRLLDKQRIEQLWGDPLLRHSNVFDGLFHEVTVVCEGDADCRFYSAILDALDRDTEDRGPDVFFTHCGGKARLPVIVKALREVNVPVRAIADFDILADERSFKAVVDALGCEWDSIEADWKIVKNAVDGKRPDLNTADVKREFDRILTDAPSTVLSEKSRLELLSVVKRSSAWSNAKLVGKSFVPSGEPMRACERLLCNLAAVGLHVVQVGELEGFCRTIGDHGPKWVTAVLARELAADPELSAAREFVKGVLFS